MSEPSVRDVLKMAVDAMRDLAVNYSSREASTFIKTWLPLAEKALAASEPVSEFVALCDAKIAYWQSLPNATKLQGECIGVAEVREAAKRLIQDSSPAARL